MRARASGAGGEAGTIPRRQQWQSPSGRDEGGKRTRRMARRKKRRKKRRRRSPARIETDRLRGKVGAIKADD